MPKIRTAGGVMEILGQGDRFQVTLTHTGMGGHPFGVIQGYKVIPDYYTHEVHRGETWEVEEVTRWSGGTDKRPYEYAERGNGNSWGAVIYARAIRRID